MNQINVQEVENGFVVYEQTSNMSGAPVRTWAFESATELSKFILAWGTGGHDGKKDDGCG